MKEKDLVFHHRCPVCMSELHNVQGEWKGHEEDCAGQGSEHTDTSKDYDKGYKKGFVDGQIAERQKDL